MPASQTDSKHEKTPTSFMLSPNCPETILLLLVITAGTTASLHSISITHIVGILLLVFTAKVINASCNAICVLARINCIRDGSKTCHQAAQASIEDVGGRVLAWISGVAPRETVLDGDSVYTAAGQQFIERAGIVGVMVTFALMCILVRAVYKAAYQRALHSVSVAELDSIPAKNESSLHSIKSATNNWSYGSDRSNPLFHLSDGGLPSLASTVENPLQESDDHSACCTACDALEAARADWVETVTQYTETSNAVMEKNDNLRTQVANLKREISHLREEARKQSDRIEYLEVLIEEAGKRLGLSENVKDILWMAYLRRSSAGEAEEVLEGPEENEEAPPTYITYDGPQAV